MALRRHAKTPGHRYRHRDDPPTILITLWPFEIFPTWRRPPSWICSNRKVHRAVKTKVKTPLNKTRSNSWEHICTNWFKNFGGHVNMAMAPYLTKILSYNVRNVSRNMHVKFEVNSFNRFWATGIYRPKILGGMWSWPCPLLKIIKQ